MSRQLIDADKAVDLITMVLPVQSGSLLLPNVSVAEIIHVAGIEAIDGAPAWFRGLLSWRGYAIPLISYEMLNDESHGEAGSELHAAVVNGSADTATVPFYALLTQSTPRMMRITPREIVEAEAGKKRKGKKKAVGVELMQVTACGEPAAIPDLRAIEAVLGKLVDKMGLKVAASA